MERRLAAILAADVVGYSRLIRADEEGTIAALKVPRADLIDPWIVCLLQSTLPIEARSPIVNHASATI